MTGIDEDEAQKTYPRAGSAMYNLMKVDREKQKKTLGKWKLLNKYFTVPLYKIGVLPMLGFGRIFILLTTIGRKLGKERTTPLEYHKIDGEIHIFSGRGERSMKSSKFKLRFIEVTTHTKIIILFLN